MFSIEPAVFWDWVSAALQHEQQPFSFCRFVNDFRLQAN